MEKWHYRYEEKHVVFGVNSPFKWAHLYCLYLSHLIESDDTLTGCRTSTVALLQLIHANSISAQVYKFRTSLLKWGLLDTIKVNAAKWSSWLSNDPAWTPIRERHTCSKVKCWRAERPSVVIHKVPFTFLSLISMLLHLLLVLLSLLHSTVIKDSSRTGMP